MTVIPNTHNNISYCRKYFFLDIFSVALMQMHAKVLPLVTVRSKMNTMSRKVFKRMPYPVNKHAHIVKIANSSDLRITSIINVGSWMKTIAENAIYMPLPQ